MFTPRHDPLLQMYLHPHVCVPSQKIHSQSLHQNFWLTIFHIKGNRVRACQSLGHDILALELDMEVFKEVLEPLIKMAMPKLDAWHVHNFNIDSPVNKHLRRLFDCD